MSINYHWLIITLYIELEIWDWDLRSGLPRGLQFHWSEQRGHVKVPARFSFLFTMSKDVASRSVNSRASCTSSESVLLHNGHVRGSVDPRLRDLSDRSIYRRPNCGPIYKAGRHLVRYSWYSPLTICQYELSDDPRSVSLFRTLSIHYRCYAQTLFPKRCSMIRRRDKTEKHNDERAQNVYRDS